MSFDRGDEERGMERVSDFFITFTIIIIWSLCQPTAGYRSLWNAMQYYQMQLFFIMFDIFPSSAYLIWGRRSASPWPYKTGRVPVHLSSVHRGHSHLLLYEWHLLHLFVILPNSVEFPISSCVILNMYLPFIRYQCSKFQIDCQLILTYLPFSGSKPPSQLLNCRVLPFAQQHCQLMNGYS